MLASLLGFLRFLPLGNTVDLSSFVLAARYHQGESSGVLFANFVGTDQTQPAWKARAQDEAGPTVSSELKDQPY